MNKALLVLVFVMSFSLVSGAQELFTEVQAQLTPESDRFTFRILGDKESFTFSAYGIHVIAPNGKEQMLDQFDSVLPLGSELDVFLVEDLNFDGFADLRIVKYLPGGANVPYLFWLYNPNARAFEKAPHLEELLSPEVDSARGELISRQRISAAEYQTNYYSLDGKKLVLLRRDERVYQADGSSQIKYYEQQDEKGLVLVKTANLSGPDL